MKTFYSNGKLLITGEYLVLDGASALAIPTKKGQSLTVKASDKKGIHWTSFDELGNAWFEANFKLSDTVSEKENKILFQLLQILREAQRLNPSFLKNTNVEVSTTLDFPRNWGLGTSSTLINNIAQWAEVDAFTSLKNSFRGSGYDVAAAQFNTPIIYRLANEKPVINEVNLNWNFQEELFFVHLNQKQDSKKGIENYKTKIISEAEINRISEISKALLNCSSLDQFEVLINTHEKIISEIIGLPTVKEKLFSDYPKTIKSLGAWGGDFVMATGNKLDKLYFKEKGYTTIVSFNEMIL